MDIITLLVTSLMTAGGLGYINYFILSRLSALTIYDSNNEDKKLIMIFFSLLNYWLYLVCYSFIRNFFGSILTVVIISIALTFIITVLLSIYVLPKTIHKAKEKLNDIRRQNGKNDTFTETVHDGFFNKYNDNKTTYIYDLQGHLIFKGYPYQWSTSKDQNLEFLATPFFEEGSIDGYDENDYNSIISYIEKENIDVDIIVNIDKKIKIIVFI